MEISYAFFAEAIQLTSDNRVNILGADLHTLNVQGPPPWTVPSIAFLVNILLEREEFGHLQHFTADLIAPDETTIEPHMENTFRTPVPEGSEPRARMNLVLQLNGMALPVAGLYHMRIKSEDLERNISVEKQVRLRVIDTSSQLISA